MINSLHLTHFKPFNNQSLPLRSLTLLSGKNGTGKSSTLQALLLLRQSYQQGYLQRDGLALNGELVQIGTARDALFEEATDDLINFELTLDSGEQGRWQFKALHQADVLPNVSATLAPQIYNSSLFGIPFAYFSGGFAYSFPTQDITDILADWMEQLVAPQWQKTSSPAIRHTLPLVKALLSAAPGALILCEHPETYLHNQGQARLGTLMALTASRGVQVIVETHSDHIFNGIRIAVYQGRLAPQDVQLHYFERDTQSSSFEVKLLSPYMNHDGRLNCWPTGFFDEWENILLELLKPPVK